MERRAMNKYGKELLKGLWKENPVFRLMLGMCPTLAVTTSVANGVGMGLAVIFVLICSNMAISAVRNIVPDKVRIPCYIVIVATFVTVVDLLMNAFLHDLHKSLGIFIPLIVVNCIILGRAEAFAAKNNVIMSALDGLGMGVGYTLALMVIAVVREIIGSGTIMGHAIGSPGVLLAVLPPGGFITLGFLMALMNHLQIRAAARAGKTFEPPAHLDCRHCMMCDLGGKNS
jgi:electron transport complex protein RnfE